jgi:glycosyltransferase involved in cell wall biosynthesis
MKKVLIICDIFPPAFAPRMGYLCKYLPENGWEPVIVTEYIPQFIYEELSKSCPEAIRVNFYHSDNKIVRKIKYAFVFLADFFFGYKDIILSKIAQEQIEKHAISLIFSSTYRTFPLRTAHRLSKKNKLPLVADLRDIIEQFPGNEHISKKFTKSKYLNRLIANILTKKLFIQRCEVLNDADAVTTVSPWHVEVLELFAENVQLIYNGFDPELFIPQIIKSNEFKITYTGRLMSEELRDPTLLFEAVANLRVEGKIDSQTFRIQFYTDDESEKALRSIAQKYHIADLIDYFGYVSNTEIPGILNSSSVLLLLTNKSTGTKTPKGIMTTKIFEYLAVEKPVLCVRNDEGCLEKTIRETRSGLSASNVEQVEQFLLEKYAEWKQNGYTHQQTDRQKVGQFSRKEQAKQFVRIFASLIEN